MMSLQRIRWKADFLKPSSTHLRQWVVLQAAYVCSAFLSDDSQALQYGHFVPVFGLRGRH